MQEASGQATALTRKSGRRVGLCKAALSRVISQGCLPAAFFGAGDGLPWMDLPLLQRPNSPLARNPLRISLYVPIG